MSPALLEKLRQQVAVRPLGRAAAGRRNRLVDLQPRQRRGKNARRARPADGGAGRIAGCQQRPPDALTQRHAGGSVIAAQTHHHVDMRRADAEIERRLVELVDRRAPGCEARRAKSNLTGAAGIVDQGEELGIAEITDLNRAAPARDRQCSEIKNQPRLMGVVLEFADRAPRTDAPAIAGVGEMPAGDPSWPFCWRHAFYGWPCYTG